MVNLANLTERQRGLVETSIDIIANKGIQNLTIKNLSKKMGFSEPAIYRHFKSKTDILLAILSMFEVYIRDNNTRGTSKSASSLNNLNEIFKQHFDTFSKNRALASVVFAEEIFQNDKRLAEKIFSIMEANFKIIKTVIEEGQKNNEIRTDIEAEQLTLIIMGSLRLIIKKWTLSNYHFEIKDSGKELWQSVKKILSIREEEK